jgi:hypothetical protein
LRHPQLGAVTQPLGHGLHENESGSPPTSDALRKQYCWPIVQNVVPHANIVCGGGLQLPFAFRSLPLL